MNYKIKLKLKYFLYYLLGIATLGLILVMAWFFDRFVEMIIVIMCFFVFRPLFDKQYHSKSLIKCSIVSAIIFTFLANIVVEKAISILLSVILAFIVTCISYYVKDYIENRILLKEYQEKIRNLNTRAIENLTEEEMLNLMPKLRGEVIHIVYGYLHKPPNISGQIYAIKCNIGEATLYRYLKLVKSTYEGLTK